MDDRGSVIFSVTWWYKCPALLHLPVCRYEWSVWGQMSASSSGPITERRWVEPQHLPLTSQRTCMQRSLSLTHTHTPSDRWRRRYRYWRKAFGWSPPPHRDQAMSFLVSLLRLVLLFAPHFRPLLSIPVSTSLSRSLSLRSSPPLLLLTHPLSYDNLFWLLTSCLSLIQYSGFTAIQPWPITIWHFHE